MFLVWVFWARKELEGAVKAVSSQAAPQCWDSMNHAVCRREPWTVTGPGCR